MSGDQVVQSHCPHCGAEHPLTRAWAISRQQEPCGNCGKLAPVYTNHWAYAAALRALRQNGET